MKYCNLNCKHINASIIERCGEGVGYEFRCMAQKGMPKVTTDTYCPYEEISEAKNELEVYKKALEESKENNNLLLKAYRLLAKDYCEDMGCAFCNHRAKCIEANHFEDLEGKDYLQLLFIKKAREE